MSSSPHASQEELKGLDESEEPGKAGAQRAPYMVGVALVISIGASVIMSDALEARNGGAGAVAVASLAAMGVGMSWMLMGRR